MDKLHVRLTQKEWFEFIRRDYSEGVIVPEINFWKPGIQQGFSAVEPGELFGFKLHNKHTQDEEINGEIVGGATFVRYERNKIRDAWNKYGRGNGSASCMDLMKSMGIMDQDQVIGCIILKNPFFFDPKDWIVWEKDPKEGYGCKTFKRSNSSDIQVLDDFELKISTV